MTRPLENQPKERRFVFSSRNSTVWGGSPSNLHHELALSQSMVQCVQNGVNSLWDLPRVEDVLIGSVFSGAYGQPNKKQHTFEVRIE